MYVRLFTDHKINKNKSSPQSRTML